MIMIYVHLCAGLGPTVSELDVSDLQVFPKTKFSMCLPEVMDKMKDHPGEATVWDP